jgi:hypothetical protein
LTINQPEKSDDQWVFEFDNSLRIRDQFIATFNDHYLLNVRKVYTNNTYFGVQFTTLDETGSICHQAKCKDRGFTEDIADHKDYFLEKYSYIVSMEFHSLINKSEKVFRQVKAPFLNEYNLTFFYDENNVYNHSIAEIGSATFRGLYGVDTERRYQQLIDDHQKIAFLNREPTEDEVRKYLIEPGYTSLSNVITRENTTYSKIRVFHKTEI